MKIESMPGYNVRSVKKDTKRSSVLLLRLVSFFTEQTLVLGTNGLTFFVQSFVEITKILKWMNHKMSIN